MLLRVWYQQLAKLAGDQQAAYDSSSIVLNPNSSKSMRTGLIIVELVFMAIDSTIMKWGIQGCK
jgi:hypothetical protein